MRGDWIHDWVQVEMDYRTGRNSITPLSSADKRRLRARRPRWAALLAAPRQLHLTRRSREELATCP